MKLTTIEQFDLIGTVRQLFARRRRAQRVQRVRDNADAVFFAGLAEQHRLTARADRADSIRRAIWGMPGISDPALRDLAANLTLGHRYGIGAEQ